MKNGLKYVVGPMLAMCVCGAANAAVVVLPSVNINVWHGTNPGGNSTDPAVQALPSASGSLTFQGNYSYSGPISFSDTDQAVDFEDTFIPGIGLPHVQMSSAPFDVTTLMEFTFTLASSLTGVTLTHDDGFSLYDLANDTVNLAPGNSAPTSAVTTALPNLLAGHTYQIWYAATNGAPSVLRLEADAAAVPEPASWAMFIGGFGVIGAAMRRKNLGATFTKFDAA